MRFPLFKSVGLSLLLAAPFSPTRAQQVPKPAADTLHKFERPATGVGAVVKKSFFQSKGFRASVVPAVLIGYGISTIHGHGFYSSYDAKSDINHLFGPGRHTHVDDFLQFAPYLELGGVLLAGVESRNDRVNLGLVILKSELIMVSSVFIVKYATNIDRPDGTPTAFPSGHTAQAFLAASILHTELRDKSQWYGIGAYTLASGVAALRMINDKHWESDVVAGAGFGILSAHLGYLTHRYRWGHKPGGTASSLHVTPLYYAGATGLSLNWQPR
ncbi:phosphatase PAP2 family protein [Hymenobacter profundi]|uniref:Phosphatase PAP2 family protein n=1 Tax=Hymenobacter profundi TaxID=1982110 RepID=A0ABS6WVR4_9BACT|nr:phosphatase PAP2 family protein [Hymenobacter profundi]MBW3127151.1 phosphatase PAP2 family protein [Hymenobacter profundi]